MGNRLMEEKNYENWKKSLQNFAWLVDVVPGATDMDCVVHASTKQGDHFLVMEFKQPGERLPMGQRILLNAIQKQKGWTVVVVWGPDKQGLYVLSYDWHGKVDRDSLTSLVKNWWDTAKGLD